MNLHIARVEKLKRCQRPLPTILEVSSTTVRPKRQRTSMITKMVTILTMAMIVMSAMAVIRVMRAKMGGMHASIAGVSSSYIGLPSSVNANMLAP